MFSGIKPKRSAEKKRLSPGAVFVAFNAASISSVPLPQNGSNISVSGYILARSHIAAPSVSLSGASFDFLL